MADDDQDIPNKDLSLREQYAQYAYGKTIAEVMVNPERDASEITSAAARAGMDVIFGEDHSLNNETLSQIKKMIDALPSEQIKAIVLESPTEVQYYYEPSTVQSLTFEEFAIGYLEAELSSSDSVIQKMFDDGIMSEGQFGIFQERSEFFYTVMNDMKAQNNIGVALSGLRPLYEIIVEAAEKGIPVIAGDVNRDREVAIEIMQNGLYDEDGIDVDKTRAIMNEGIDDTSDFEHLSTMGINLDDPGIFIIHRGHNHIDGTLRFMPHSDGVLPEEPNTNGFDEVLENQGRHVLTVGVLWDSDQGMASFNLVTHPADINLYMNRWTKEIELDREVYTGEKQFIPPERNPEWWEAPEDLSGADAEPVAPNTSPEDIGSSEPRHPDGPIPGMFKS